MNISSVTTQATAPASTVGSTEMDKNAFLKLLTAQLRYQDPSNPVSSDQFMSQMAQFSSLEQMTNISQNTESNLWNSQVTQAVQTIGKQVSWVDPVTNESRTGTVSGVTMSDKKILLQIGEEKVPVTLVMGVSA
jgi:flagellar basal-body rod modification protein FlgD